METPGPPPLFAPQVTPPPPPAPRQSRWTSTKSVVNIVGYIVWISLLVFPGVLFNAYIFAGIDFDNDSLARAWAVAGIGTVYGGALLSAIIAQALIVTKNVRWRALAPLWLISPVAQVAWLFAYNWAGGKYGFICC